MKHLIMAVALAAGCAAMSSSPALAATRTYDCSKAGNANKAACKTAAKPAAVAKAPKAAKAAKATPKVAKAAPAKAAPKAAAAPSAKPTFMQRMGGMFSRSTPATAAKARPAAAPRRAAAATASAEDRDPRGAIAQCKDGTYSHAKVRNGACSRHGGVGKWS
jgi:hypothetical protein